MFYRNLSSKAVIRSFSYCARRMQSGLGDLGSGSGKSGGSGGSIRDAGGAFGKLEAAREEEYFHKLKTAQLKALKQQLEREKEHHEDEAKHHADIVKRHEKRIAELEAEANEQKK